MSNQLTSPTAKVKPVPHGVLFGNVTLKDILNEVVLESSDLDSCYQWVSTTRIVSIPVMLMRAYQKRK